MGNAAGSSPQALPYAHPADLLRADQKESRVSMGVKSAGRASWGHEDLKQGNNAPIPLTYILQIPQHAFVAYYFDSHDRWLDGKGLHV